MQEDTDFKNNTSIASKSASLYLSFLDKPSFRILLLLSSALLTALTLIFTDIWIVEWISLIPAGMVVLRLAENASLRLRSFYLYGLIFFWGYYAVVFHWFVSMYPLSFTGLSRSSAVFVILAGIFGLSLLQALISGFAFVVYGVASRNRFLQKYRFLRPFLFAASFTVFEWLQNFGWWGVPWGRLPLGQIDSLITVQTSQLLGSYLVTFLLLSVNMCLAYSILYVSLRKVALITACAIFSSNLLVGAALFLTSRNDGKKLTVAAIQGNISNKWDFDTLETTKEIYRKYTLLAAKDGADIIVWSETALPYDLESSPSLVKYLQELAREADATLLVGAFRSEKRREYNSLFLFSPDGTVNDVVYDKQQLVPFGEFVPMRETMMILFPPLADVGMLDDDLSRGEAGKNIPTEHGVIGGMICFDSIYDRVALRAVQNGAELFCLSSNDSWFMDSAAIYMHHNQARLRAIETGRYVVRSGNSGITSVIDHTGKVLTEIEPLTEGYVVSEVCFRTNRTLYSLVGNLFSCILTIGLSIPCAASTYFHVYNAIIRVKRRKNG